MLTYGEKTHLDTLKQALLPSHQVTKRSDWICNNTRLNQRRFSFVGHEYQKTIIDDTATVKSIKKSSQIGISELSVRNALAFLQMNPGTTIITVLPTATFAQTFSKTRFSTCVDESPEIADCMKPGNDSSALKIMRNGSQCHFKGAASGSAAISIPADFLIFDEYDFFENVGIMTQYMSRLTHSKHKEIFSLSTPTLPGRGISSEFDKSMQFVELTKCNHCNHFFTPDYFDNVKLPGFNAGVVSSRRKNDSLTYFNYQNRDKLSKFDLKLTYLECPKCRKPVDTSIDFREWVCVNPDSNISAHSYHVTPFSAPAFVSPADLIRASATYQLYSDFVNFGLGESHDTSENSLSEGELLDIFKPPESQKPSYSIMGLDLGGLCWATIAVPTPCRTSFRVIHVEAIPLNKLDERYFELLAEFRVICTVSDAMPYTSDIIKMQRRDHNLWGATFITSKNLELFKVAEKVEDKTKATFDLRQININRDRALDLVVDMVREDNISYNYMDNKHEIISHLRDLKRIKKIDRYGEVGYVWVKSASGDDHAFFSLMYCTMALFMLGTVKGSIPLPFLMTSAKFSDESD